MLCTSSKHVHPEFRCACIRYDIKVLMCTFDQAKQQHLRSECLFFLKSLHTRHIAARFNHACLRASVMKVFVYVCLRHGMDILTVIVLTPVITSGFVL